MRSLAVTLGTVILAFTMSLTASDEITRVRELYRSAAYDEALGVLDSIPAAGGTADAIEVHEYRVLCLVALDRKDDAKAAIGALVKAAPHYHLSDQQASPRVRAMFNEVRLSLLPTIVQAAYADAKAAFDRKDPDAPARFDRVLALLHDPDVAAIPGLADLATVASGFRDLSKAQAATPPPAVTAVPTRRATAAAPTVVSTITPPVAVSQAIPPLIMREPREWNGEVEVVINEAGKVVSARMSKTIHPVYDTQLLRAARSWTYKPALKDGVPTQMMKVVSVHIDSRPTCSPKITSNCRTPDAN